MRSRGAVVWLPCCLRGFLCAGVRGLVPAGDEVSAGFWGSARWGTLRSVPLGPLVAGSTWPLLSVPQDGALTPRVEASLDPTQGDSRGRSASRVAMPHLALVLPPIALGQVGIGSVGRLLAVNPVGGVIAAPQVSPAAGDRVPTGQRLCRRWLSGPVRPSANRRVRVRGRDPAKSSE